MNKELLNRFQDYVAIHYSDCNLNTKNICSNIYCTVKSLQRTLASYNNCSIMKYVEYFRILKAIELTYYRGEKKVYYKVGYKHHSGFCRSFFRVTKLNLSYFSPIQFKENKKVAREVHKIAKQNPKNAINLILEDVAERPMLSK